MWGGGRGWLKVMVESSFLISSINIYMNFIFYICVAGSVPHHLVEFQTQ